jgi:hypothetical protein
MIRNSLEISSSSFLFPFEVSSNDNSSSNSSNNINNIVNRLILLRSRLPSIVFIEFFIVLQFIKKENKTVHFFMIQNFFLNVKEVFIVQDKY